MADFEDRVSDEEKVRGPPLSFTSSPEGAQGSESAAVGNLAVSPGKRRLFPGAGIFPLHPGCFLPERSFRLPHGGPSPPFLNSSFHSGQNTTFLQKRRHFARWTFNCRLSSVIVREEVKVMSGRVRQQLFYRFWLLGLTHPPIYRYDWG